MSLLERLGAFCLYHWLSITGLRFYETNVRPQRVEVMRTVFEIVDGRQVEFRFYREIYDNFRFRNGKFVKFLTEAFVVESMFDASLPPKIVKFNNARYFFGNNAFRRFSDRVVSDVLLRVYSDFVASQNK